MEPSTQLCFRPGAKSRGAASPLIVVGGAWQRDPRCYWRRLGARKLNLPQRPTLPRPAPWAPRARHGCALPCKFLPAGLPGLTFPARTVGAWPGDGFEGEAGFRASSLRSQFTVCAGGAGWGHVVSTFCVPDPLRAPGADQPVPAPRICILAEETLVLVCSNWRSNLGLAQGLPWAQPRHPEQWIAG